MVIRMINMTCIRLKVKVFQFGTLYGVCFSVCVRVFVFTGSIQSSLDGCSLSAAKAEWLSVLVGLA